jgi:hypothetical protein
LLNKNKISQSSRNYFSLYKYSLFSKKKTIFKNFLCNHILITKNKFKNKMPIKRGGYRRTRGGAARGAASARGRGGSRSTRGGRKTTHGRGRRIVDKKDKVKDANATTLVPDLDIERDSSQFFS